MKISHLLSIACFCSFICIFYGTATAATIMQVKQITSQSGEGNPAPDEVFTFNGFDSQLGTLNSVEFSYNLDLNLYADCVAYYDCNIIGNSVFDGQGIANELYLTNSTGWVNLPYSSTPQLIDQTFSLSDTHSFTSGNPFVDAADFDIWLDISGQYYGGGASIAYQSPAGGDVTLTYTYSPVPMPAAVWLFGSGLLGLLGIARRNKMT